MRRLYQNHLLLELWDETLLVLLPFVTLQVEIFIVVKSFDCFLRPKLAICTKLLNKMGLYGAVTLLGSCGSASTMYPVTSSIP